MKSNTFRKIVMKRQEGGVRDYFFYENLCGVKISYPIIEEQEKIVSFLELINQNWTLITVIIGLGILVFKRIKSYLSLSEQEKITLALKQIRVTALKMVTDAECVYEDWVKAGAIKRSEVINEIFEKYPILNKVTDQEVLIKTLDDIIDDALVEMRKIIEENIK
jgi:type I restriction enzyme S subunit